MFDNYRIYLRALEMNDYRKSINWRRDDEIWDMLVGPKYYVSEDYEKKWVEDIVLQKVNRLVLSVCMKESSEHVGYVYLDDINYKNRTGSFSLLIGEKQYWGRGLGKECVMLMLYHAFYVIGLQRIEARQLITNTASIKVCEKCGFVTEGILRKAIYKHGEYVDLNLIAVLKSDFDRILNETF